MTFYVTSTGKTGAPVGNVFVVAEPELKGVRTEGGGADAMAKAMLAGAGAWSSMCGEAATDGAWTGSAEDSPGERIDAGSSLLANESEGRESVV